ncbi:hypothetical protein D3C75_723540 [compost metagenome]
MLTRFTFACKTNTVTGIDASRDFHRQGFRFLYTAMTMTGIARIFNNRAATLAVRTTLLHGEEALAHLHLTLSMTSRASLRLRASFRAATVANTALFKRWDTDLFGDATNRFFQR